MHQVNILIFQGSPQALCKYVVHASPPAIHADINPIILDSCGEGGAGKLGPLIAIEDFRFPKLKGHFQRLQTERRIQRCGCLPCKDESTPPVHDRHQVHEASGERDIGYVGGPHLILPVNGNVPEQIRINLVPWMRIAQAGLLIDGLQTHFPHQTLDMLSVDPVLVPPELLGHFPRTVKRRQGVLLVNQTFQQKVIFINHRLIVNAGSGYPQKLRLMTDGYFSAGYVNEQHLLFMA